MSANAEETTGQVPVEAIVHKPTYCGQSADRGEITAGRLYPGEGYATITCGNTTVKIGYTTLASMVLKPEPSRHFNDQCDFIRAFHSIVCEASLGRISEVA